MKNDREGIWYRLFGWWIRWQACKMASNVVASWTSEPESGVCPMLWSATVFFESYMVGGSAATEEEFGPKEPVKLEVAAKGE